MSNYRYILSDYHAIRKADIALNGITVLTGVNGCGKSTLSRWLSYLVNGIEEFKWMAYTDFLGDMELLNTRLMGISLSFDMNNKYGLRSATHEAKKYLEGRRALDFSEENVNQTKDMMERLMLVAHTALSDYLSRKENKGKATRILLQLRLTPIENELPLDTLERFIDDGRKIVDRSVEVCLKRIETRSSDYFRRFVNMRYDVRNEFPSSIRLSEDGTDVFPSDESEKKVGVLLGLYRAIYVDSPMTVSESGFSQHWERLREYMMYDERKNELSLEKSFLISHIEKLLGGDVRVAKKNLTDDKELRYVRSDGLSIVIDEAATGFKTLAYIHRLLSNGMLDDKTILIIDEPEAHLHPQWIAEFAYILVKICKVAGTKLLLTTHNPHLMVALKEIAQKEDVLKLTKFYLAQAEDDGNTFSYKDLDQDMEPVFEAFNMVYDKIEKYGQRPQDFGHRAGI